MSPADAFDAHDRAHPTLESLAEALSGTGPDATATLAHLDGCPECKAHVLVLREIEGGLASLGGLTMPDDVWQRQLEGLQRARRRPVHPHWLAATGAVAASVVAAGLLFGVVDRSGNPPSSDLAQQDAQTQEGAVPGLGSRTPPTGPTDSDATKPSCSAIEGTGSEGWLVPVPDGVDLTVDGPVGLSVTFDAGLTYARVSAPQPVRITASAYADGTGWHRSQEPALADSAADQAITEMLVCYRQ